MNNLESFRKTTFEEFRLQQNQISMSREKLEDFKSISKLIAETLRKDILNDTGISRLK